MTASVLVVDDELGMRETLVDILADAGYEATAVGGGDAALRRLRERDVDVVLMDIRMPGRDGVSVLRELGSPPPQVIMMTAYAVEEQLRQAVDNAFAVVHKPFAVSHLLTLVAGAAAETAGGA
jgi:CheY-like chemotaxis protein